MWCNLKEFHKLDITPYFYLIHRDSPNGGAKPNDYEDKWVSLILHYEKGGGGNVKKCRSIFRLLFEAELIRIVISFCHVI